MTEDKGKLCAGSSQNSGATRGNSRKPDKIIEHEYPSSESKIFNIQFIHQPQNMFFTALIKKQSF
jgi:hypothetical protein